MVTAKTVKILFLVNRRSKMVPTCMELFIGGSVSLLVVMKLNGDKEMIVQHDDDDDDTVLPEQAS